METPSSTKRVTSSMTRSASDAINTHGNNSLPLSKNTDDSDKGISKSRRRNQNQQQQEQEDRIALFDITNDSPIGGLAMGCHKTPLSSSFSKQRSVKAKNNTNNGNETPGSGSGEALLRGQVKTLLQKVEEEAELSKVSIDNRPFLYLEGFFSSPLGLLVAPTPANTPQVPNLSVDGGIADDRSGLMTPSLPVVEEQLVFCPQEMVESQKSLNRSLLLDFCEKCETWYSSESSPVVIEGESECNDKASTLTDDDNASIWSIQVNASTHGEEDEEEEAEEDNQEEEEGEEVEDDMMMMMPRFVYDSDDDDIIIKVEDDVA